MHIVLHNVTKKYEYPVKCLALSDVNLQINHGESVALMGKSGCGKSTLINILAGLTDRTSGDYYCNNIKLSNERRLLSKFRRDNVGIIVQNFALLNNRTAYDNIALSINKSTTKKMIYDLAEKLDIINKLDNYPYQLSGGECQRIAIARALIKNPSIILADEPTGSLDSANGQMVMNILKELTFNGATLIIATHDKSISNKCDRIIEMIDGKIVKSDNGYSGRPVQS
ncbi:MAG: ABC transporter ATP-binding protein [Oscillospiraceae bacterium]|nr:ABC transporter ATP-binding protein [Oscillospiraceae bacterium]